MRFEIMNDLTAVLSTEGRVGGPCWEKLKLKRPQGSTPQVSKVRCVETTFGS